MIRVRQVKVLVEENNTEQQKRAISKKLHVKPTEILSFTIHKESIDARKKDAIYYVYEFDVQLSSEEKYLSKHHSDDILKTPDETYHLPQSGTIPLAHRPIIVGCGPAGLFAGYLLAEAGYRPILIDRGEKIEDRVKTVEEFWQTGKLNPESNVQFGEGGAGTFSDGKLNTLVKDKKGYGRKVFETFVKYGAPKEILYLQKPHIGTDLLRKVIIDMRTDMMKMGAEFLYQTCFTDIILKDGKICGIEVNHQRQIPCEVVILALGHSARDTFELLYERKLSIEAKPFALGLRVQHPQAMIDVSQYGEKYAKRLSPASYKLTYTTKNGRGVYSFCMCPGGYVVNASSEEGLLAINGMSYHDRNSKNANSAIVVTITPEDFGTGPLDGMYLQRTLEKKAYQLGKGQIPLQLWKDYQENKVSTSFGEVKPEIKGKYQFCNLRDLLPEFIQESLLEAIPVFGKRIHGFDRPDFLLAGIESRTSSPIRMVRDEHYSSNIRGIYPCGEGAGYAGGITTAAIDGVKVAEEIINTYSCHQLQE